MRKMIIFVLLLGLIFALGCAGGGNVRKIGKNTYSVSVSWNPLSIAANAEALWHKEANKACPNGYRVITRSTKNSEFDIMGTIECE